jgi:hypothetical protein
MSKRKYEKPLVKTLSTGVSGDTQSCASGHLEQSLHACTPGGTAISTCSGGTVPYPPIVCTPSGPYAGYSCVDGADAG